MSCYRDWLFYTGFTVITLLLMHLKLFSTIFNFDFAHAYDGFAHAPGISSQLYYTTFGFLLLFFTKVFWILHSKGF